MRLRTETSKNPSFRVSGSRVTDNPETWINPAKPEDIFGNVLMDAHFRGSIYTEEDGEHARVLHKAPPTDMEDGMYF